VTLLGDMEGSGPTLVELAQSQDLTIRTIAALGLLKQRDPACWPALRSFLIRDARDLIWLQDRSPGFSLVTWRRMASAQQSCANQPHLLHYAERYRHEVLLQAAHLPLPTFLQIAEEILLNQQHDLVMTTTRILEYVGPEGVELLQRLSERAGAPFVRTACHLALLRAGAEGPHEERLVQWLKANSELALALRQTARPDPTEVYRTTLSPDERSQLILDISTTLASHPTPTAIDALLDLLAQAHPTVRVAVAACLLQALT
jgi:hypothetical protein